MDDDDDDDDEFSLLVLLPCQALPVNLLLPAAEMHLVEETKKDDDGIIESVV